MFETNKQDFLTVVENISKSVEVELFRYLISYFLHLYFMQVIPAKQQRTSRKTKIAPTLQQTKILLATSME